MTGLDLERFLRLLRADWGAWASLGAILLILALLAWTSWGSRRALRKCLVLSLIAHFGLVLYGSTIPVVMLAIHPKSRREAEHEHLREVRVTPWSEGARAGSDRAGAGGRKGLSGDAFDRPGDTLALADTKVDASRPEPVAVEPARPEPPAPELATATPEPVARLVLPPENRPEEAASKEPAAPPPEVSPADSTEVAAPVTRRSTPEPEADPLAAPGEPQRLRPDRPARNAARAERPPDLATRLGAPVLNAPSSAPAERPSSNSGENESSPTVTDTDPATSGVTTEVVKRRAEPLPQAALPESDLRLATRPNREVSPTPHRRPTESARPLTLAAAAPRIARESTGLLEGTAGRPLVDVPEVYRPRLDPNRSQLAQRAGASPASEQAVERALDWLMRHQDADGRWDGAVAKYEDGTAKKGDDDFTIHCPPGETCFGECLYWEADTALTGLALLAYLGAGYTQTDGKYAETVRKGLDFLLDQQRPSGDLRGPSRAVGMYCHAMATLALCEAYALTAEERLRDPVERAVGFLVRSRARDGLAWRYAPGAPDGDTSILGWVVMALKSAKVVGVSVPPTVPRGALGWLDKVSEGPRKGLARYRPDKKVSPTMTAEAWVCRQFLGVGGPGPSSTEAADYLLAHAPDRGPFNLYYWYYGTLAMYQHGGEAWSRWNARTRDQIVRRQRTQGHQAGSWDPDESEWGTYGGRIYCTVLATLTLEVYYRFLRLYDDPKLPPARGR